MNPYFLGEVRSSGVFVVNIIYSVSCCHRSPSLYVWDAFLFSSVGDFFY